MQRKLIVTVGILLLSGLGIWLADRFSILSILPIDPVDVLPADAGLVITLPQTAPALELLAKDTLDPWQKAMIALPGVQQDLSSMRSLLDTLFPSRTVIDLSQGLLSLDAVNNGALNLTLIVDLRNMGTLNPEEWLKKKRLSYQTSSFRGQAVWTVKLGQAQIAISKVRNLLVLAPLPYQVEAVLAVDQDDNNWVKELQNSLTPGASFSIYINTLQLSDLVKNIFSQTGRRVGSHWSEWFEKMRLDIIGAENGYRLEGVFRAPGGWLSTHLSPAPMHQDLWGMLPNNTAGIRAINLSDYLSYFRRSSRLEVGRFQRFFLPWMQGPLLELTLRPFDAEINERQLYFFGFEDQSVTTAALNEWMEEVGVLQNDDYQGFPLTQVYDDQSLFPFSTREWNNSWWTTVGKYIVLATDRGTLENWIDQYVVGNALPLTEVVRQMTLSESDGQFFFFLDWRQWRTGWRYLLADPALAAAATELGQLSLRFKSKGSQGRISGLWQQNGAIEKEEDFSWRFALTDDVAAGPWWCQPASGSGFIAVQDAGHRLYLIDGTGQKIWQRNLSTRILSEPRIIDRDGRSLITFNTANAIHLMDLAGAPLAPFPLRLGNPTTLAQTVVDFSADKNYTFFVIATDGCVYGYDLQGGAVEGWNPKCQLGEISQPLLHFQDDNKDYLALKNTNGDFRLFARDGSIRQQASFPPGPSASPLQYQLSGGTKQVVSFSDSGVVAILPLEGPPIQFRLPVGKNFDVKMVYEDVEGDRRRDFLIAAQNTVALHAYNRRGLVKAFERQFPQAIDTILGLTPGGKSDRNYIGVLLKGSHRIYLLDPDGDILPGFPIAGSTPFFLVDLFQSGEQHLVVGYQDEILAYRLHEGLE